MGDTASAIAPSDELREQLSSSSLTLELYDYWLSRRCGRALPSRADLDPVDIPAHLPCLMLIDVLHEPLRFRYRLIGTRVVDASGEDRTGRFFDEVSFFRRNPAVEEQYRAVVDTGQPLHSAEPFTNHEKGTSYSAKRLLLPLSLDGERVDMVLVFFDFRSGPYSNR